MTPEHAFLQEVSAEILTLDPNSQDVSAENLISEARKTDILQFLMNVSADIVVFPKFDGCLN